jgi:dTDP-4-amino-4,6-dideoxygalactose transaminase
VFVDIEESTFNLDPSHLRAAVLKSERVRAIQPVHLFGGVADMAPIRAVAKEFGLPIVEDAAQAIGAEYQGLRAGAIGDIGCFSFYPGKNLGGYGDAGLLTTNDDSLAERLRLLRIHGGKDKYFHDEVGINSRIDTLQAAVLKVKLPYLDRWTQARQANAAAYRPLLQGMEDQLRVPATASYQTRHVFNQFTLLARNRDSLKRYLFEQGVGTEIYYPLPLHLQKCFRYLGYEEGSLPVAEECAKRALSIPVHPELSQEDREYVASAIRDFYR